jgi:hypothetical protein
MKRDVWERLTEWRRAERHRDALAEGSPAWQEAEADVRRARTAYRAELAQVTARHREAGIPQSRHFWSPARAEPEVSGD